MNFLFIVVFSIFSIFLMWLFFFLQSNEIWILCILKGNSLWYLSIWKPRDQICTSSSHLYNQISVNGIELTQGRNLSKNSQSLDSNARTRVEINTCSFVATAVIATVTQTLLTLKQMCIFCTLPPCPQKLLYPSSFLRYASISIDLGFLA